jgi:hypothetical protein
MANKKIEFKFDFDSKDVDIVSDKLLSLREQVKLLQKELLKTEEGSAEFEILKNKLNDTKDNMERVNAKSRELFGTLQLIPGPIGDIASKVDGTISLLKTFSGFTFKDIKSSISALVKDFGDIAVNIGKATGITKIYTVLNGALANSFKAVGIAEGVAATGARAFAAALTATGIGALVVAIGFAISKLMEYASSTDDADAAQKRFNSTLQQTQRILGDTIQVIKDKGEIQALEAKKAGKSAQEIQQIRLQSLKDQIEVDKKALGAKGEFEKRALDIGRLSKEQQIQASDDLVKAKNAAGDRLYTNQIALQKLTLEGEIENQEAIKKAGETAASNSKKTASERAQIEKDLQSKIKQYLEQGYEAKEKTRQTELDKAKEQFTALEAELKKNKKSTVEITAAYNEIIGKINKDYDEKDLKRTQEKDAAVVELETARIAKSKNSVEDLKKFTEAAYQDELKNFKGTAEEKELIRLKYDKIIEDAQKSINDRKVKELQLELDQTKGNADEQIRITAELQEQLKNVENPADRFALQKGYQDNLLALLDTSYSNQKATIETNYDEFKRFDSQYYDDQRQALEKYGTDLKSAYEKGTITKEQFTARDKQLAQARKDINKQEVASNQEKTKLIGDALGQLSTIVGQDTTAGKAFAIAKATIDTYQSAVAAYKSLAGIPVIGPALGAIAAAAAVASGVATVKKIVAVQIPSAPANTGGNATQTTPSGPGERPIVSANATSPVGKAQGGLVRGGGGAFSDSIPAMLSDGEFVVNSRSAKMFQPLLTSINESGNLPGFAAGGAVSKSNRPQQDNTETLINAIQQSFGDTPIRTYVTANDISNQQQFDRTIKSRSLI